MQVHCNRFLKMSYDTLESTVVPPNSRFIGSTVEKTRELDFLKDILSLKNLELGILLMGIKRNVKKKVFRE